MVLPAARHAHDDERVRPDGIRGDPGRHLCADQPCQRFRSKDLYGRTRLAQQIEPTFAGYSIGKWTDADAAGHYHALEIETRGLKSPRTYDATGLPFHKDGQTVIKERIHLDTADRNFLYNDITVIDHALTRPWTVTKKYRRLPAQPPEWRSQVCAEANSYVRIHDEAFFLSADGY